MEKKDFSPFRFEEKQIPAIILIKRMRVSHTIKVGEIVRVSFGTSNQKEYMYKIMKSPSKNKSIILKRCEIRG